MNCSDCIIRFRTLPEHRVMFNNQPLCVVAWYINIMLSFLLYLGCVPLIPLFQKLLGETILIYYIDTVNFFYLVSYFSTFFSIV